MKLTLRQQQIVDFIEEQQRVNGLTPSTREIQRHFGFGSQTTVMDHLRALQAKGVLRTIGGKARALVLPHVLNRPATVTVPIFGSIPAGMASPVEEQSEGSITIDIDSLHISKEAKTFGLKVRGDSMIDAGIQEGDIVILERREPRNREVVAALIDRETTLKRYIVQRNKPFLKAENPAYPNLIPAQELIIQGVMIALIRLVKN